MNKYKLPKDAYKRKYDKNVSKDKILEEIVGKKQEEICLEDKISYMVACKQIPDSHCYHTTYEEAVKWAKRNQPAYKPFYIIKRTEHFEICDVIDKHISGKENSDADSN